MLRHRLLSALVLVSLLLSACLPQSTATPPPPTQAQPDPALKATLDNAEQLGRFPPEQPLTVRFNQPMKADSAELPLLTYPNVAGDYTWNNDRTTVTFKPKERLAPGQIYQVGVNRALLSVKERAFASLPLWNLQVPPAPAVVSHLPETAQVEEPRPVIQFGFDRAMDQASVAAALSVEPALPFAVSWQGYTATLTLQQPLVAGVQYHFTLAHSATDSAGIPLAQDYTWNHWRAGLQTMLSRGGPAGNATLVFAYNYPLDAASWKNALKIEPPIEGPASWDAEHRMVTLTPTLYLKSAVTYTVSFTGNLRDTSGNPIAPPPPFEFTTPPAVSVQTNLANMDGSLAQFMLEKGQPIDTIIVAFDRSVNRAAAEQALRFSPPMAGLSDWADNTLYFHPAKNTLVAGDVYTLTIAPDVTDPAGQRLLDKPVTFMFRAVEGGGWTGVPVTFGRGPNAQVLDADGRRAVQFAAPRGSKIVDFALYRLSPEQFLAEYSSSFRGVAGQEDRPISAEGKERVTAWQTDTGAASDQKYWDGKAAETMIPADVPPGLYILQLSDGEIHDELLILLTRYTLVLKQTEGQIVTWATDINGGNAAGLEVGVYARDGQRLAQGQTDANGLYRVEGGVDPQPLIVIARKGSDVTAAGLNVEWRTGQNWWWGWWEGTPQSPDYAAYVYTDRPIYRPGQTMFFKAIVRQDNDAVLSLPPEGTPVTLTIRDTRSNVVQTGAYKTNAFGSVNGQFQLAEGAMLGSYAVEAVTGAGTFKQIFKVQDYRKPEYELSVTTDAAQYVISDTIQVTVDASYFFGEPVPDAAVTVTLYELFPNYGWGETAQEGEAYTWYLFYDTPTLTAQTDKNGRCTLTLPAKHGRWPMNVDWYSSATLTTMGIEVTIADDSHQAVSTFAAVKVYDAAEKLSLDIGGYLKAPGEAFTVQAQAATIFDQPAANRALRLELLQYNYPHNRFDTVVQAVDLKTDAKGQAKIPVTAQAPGYYKLALTGADAQGRRMSAERWLYVYRDTDGWAKASDHNRGLKISADKASYAPGDTARLIIETPVSGPALLTFERGTLRREKPVNLTAPITVLEVPVQPDDAPNIFVTVNVWQTQSPAVEDIYAGCSGAQTQADSKLLTASVELPVPVTDKTLTVTITPDKTSYAPREKAAFTVRVTDAGGKPVSAEVSLAMVDEAIFSLSDDLSGSIFDAFYHKRQNLVSTFDSMSPVRYLPVGGGCGGGGGGGDAGSNPRSNFPDTAVWLPALQTNANGEVTVNVTLPDSLTSWRLTAKAVTAQTQVGEGKTNVVTQQEIVVRPVLPRTLTAGDTVELSAFVHNYGSEQRDLAVSIEITASLQVETPLKQTISLKPGAQSLVSWKVKAQAEGEAFVTVRAEANGVTGDAVRLPLTVQPLAVPDFHIESGEFTTALNTTVFFPNDALDMSTVKLELNRTIAGSLLTGLDYLTGFPYGCVEQTMSRALPNAVVGRAFQQLGVSSPTLQADLPPRINAGLQRLYGYQHSDGGWGWWYDDETHDYQTAWVVFGLAMTKEAGYTVDDGVIQRGADWLKQHLSEMDPRTRAFALYSLAIAGYGDLKSTRALAGQAHELDTFSQAALALALHQLQRPDESKALLNALAESAVVENDNVYWPSAQEDGHYYDKVMASTTRSTALALDAFTRIQPGHKLEAGIVRWLMNQRRQDGWGSTNETSFAILALTDHLLSTEFATADTNYQVLLNGAQIASGTLGRGEPVVTLTIPKKQVLSGVNLLTIKQSGDGKLYYNLTARAYVPRAEIQAAGKVRVKREYLDAQTGAPVRSVRPGQLIKTNLTIELPDAGAYLLIEDHLPGGLEALNEKLNTASHEAYGPMEKDPIFFWRGYGYNNKEVYGDRVTFFISEMTGGSHTFTYLARATRAGQFTAMPVEVSAMYNAAQWGRSASQTLTVAPDAPIPVALPTPTLAPTSVPTPRPTSTPSPLIAVLQGHTGWVSSVAFSADGKRLASGSDDGTVRVWDIRQFTTIATLTGHTGSVLGVAYSPNGKWLASCGKDNTVRVWDASSNLLLQTLEGHTATVWGVAYSPDGKMLASVSENGETRLWDAVTGQFLRALTAPDEKTWNAAFSPDGKQLAVAGDAVRIWDVIGGSLITRLDPERLSKGASNVAYSPDGKRLAVVGETLTLWDAQNSAYLLTLKGHTDWVWGAAFSPDGRKLVSGSKDRTTRVWDVSTAIPREIFRGPAGSINGVAFSPDGTLVAAASTDQTVRMWQIAP